MKFTVYFYMDHRWGYGRATHLLDLFLFLLATAFVSTCVKK